MTSDVKPDSLNLSSNTNIVNMNNSTPKLNPGMENSASGINQALGTAFNQVVASGNIANLLPSSLSLPINRSGVVSDNEILTKPSGLFTGGNNAQAVNSQQQQLQQIQQQQQLQQIQQQQLQQQQELQQQIQSQQRQLQQAVSSSSGNILDVSSNLLNSGVHQNNVLGLNSTSYSNISGVVAARNILQQAADSAAIAPSSISDRYTNLYHVAEKGPI